MSGLHYKKDGSLDMRYSSSRQAMSSGGAFSGFSGSAASSYSSSSSYSSPSSSGLHYKKDGSLDMRYSSSKQAAGYGGGSGSAASSSSSGNTSDRHYKKDGSLDMRFSSSKEATGLAQNVSRMHVTAPASDLRYKKDGSLDMRYRSSKEAVHGAHSGRKPEPKSYGIPINVPTKKDGRPDMRTKAANDWVKDQAAACGPTTALPPWVPLKKDGSVDLTTAIGRKFAHCGSGGIPHTQREDYWRDRYELDEIFRALLEQQRRMTVDAPQPTPTQVTPYLSNVRYRRSDEDFAASVPESIPHIEFSSLVMGEDDASALGRGSFGVVLKARWNGQDVAVKKLHLDQLTKKEKDAFRKEIVILANLGTHPNLVTLYAYCLHPPCIVMELVQRGSVSHLLHYCEDPEVEANMTDGRIKKKLIVGIVNGMRQLHASRIVHGDLKPQNVLVTTDYVSKITDFGLSTLRGKTSSTVASRQFEEGEEKSVDVGGTAGYMAPELLDSTSPPDYSSDVFSFGIILNELICEEEPYSDQYANFAGRGPFGAANYAKQGKRPTIGSSTPDNVKMLIRKCWAAEAAERPSFDEVVEVIVSVTFIIPNSVQ